MRKCKGCGEKKPITRFRKQGRGRLWLCDDCDMPIKKMGGPSVERLVLNTLLDIEALLKTPRCRRCGGAGAEGFPAYHKGCQP